VSARQVAIARLLIEAVVALVLLLAMTWIVLTPTTTDEASKAALVIVGSTVGFLFGKHST
jgi:hypothetical protein